ncbi:hypothetical protein MSG76_09300 [Acinetobacter baumannii]|uniref:hypothetical protein n=1 Tax=Acinetobacter baumannii TaxID=470 RepID=UPI0029406015|nr:hypothetical protein [Acinetobacter baumannii]MDV4260448.1 hypothetical protein [Acinetobacter baumannii]
MTDLNKLRSEFESVTEIYHCIYNADLDYYFSGSKFVSDKAEIEVNAGWKAWKKAKAQAVPEGYCLVPKVANKKMVNAGYEAHDGFYTNGQVQDVYQAMIKAIESGAEQ